MASRIGVDEESSNDQIKEIYITNNEQTAVVTFSSGLISLYDTKNSYTWIGDAVDQDFAKFNTQQAAIGASAIHTIVIEMAAGGHHNASMRERMQMFGQSTSGQDEQPAYGSDMSHARRANLSSTVHGSHTSNMKILSLQTPN